MKVTVCEGVVENGQIRLKTDVLLPDKTKVYVVVPDFENKQVMFTAHAWYIPSKPETSKRKSLISFDGSVSRGLSRSTLGILSNWATNDPFVVTKLSVLLLFIFASLTMVCTAWALRLHQRANAVKEGIFHQEPIEEEPH